MKTFKSTVIWINDRREAFIWILALFLLYQLDSSAGHISLCPLSNLGYDFCPGCGLGRSVSNVLHLDIKASMEHHYLGIFAVLVLFYRITKLMTLKTLNKR